MGDYDGAPVAAARLSLRGPRGDVYRGVSFEAEPGQLVALAGGNGSGRTALLLTLAGRMRPSGGEAVVAALPLPRRAAGVRRVVALGAVAGVNDLDGGLTVEEHLTERLLLRSRGRRAHQRVAAAMTGAGLTPAELPLRADTLTAAQAFRTSLAAALIGHPRVLAVDDVGDRLSADERAAAWATLRALADDGLTVLATTREAPPEADLTVHLGTEPVAAEPSDTDTDTDTTRTEPTDTAPSEIEPSEIEPTSEGGTDDE